MGNTCTVPDPGSDVYIKQYVGTDTWKLTTLTNYQKKHITLCNNQGVVEGTTSNDCKETLKKNFWGKRFLGLGVPPSKWNATQWTNNKCYAYKKFSQI
tara:strand:+ start:464 stop:757 length:294 start_codon:yes stop_codon:yes gene_type:complete